MQDQEACDRREGSHTNANIAEPDGRERPATTPSAKCPVESLGAGSEDTMALEATAEDLETLETRSEPAPRDMALERPEDAKAAESELVAASSMDKSDAVSLQPQHNHTQDEQPLRSCMNTSHF